MALDEIITVEQYEWVVYIYSGIALTVVGLCLLAVLIITEQSDSGKIIPAMIAAMICLVMSLYFFSEGYNMRKGEGTATEIYIESDA